MMDRFHFTRTWLWMLASALICSPVQFALPGYGAGEGNGLSLEGAVALALKQNPELRAFSARVEAAGGQAVQAGLWPNPELEFEAEEWPVSGGGRFSDSKRVIGVSQTLPWPGKKLLDRRSGGANVLSREAELDLRRTEIVRDVKAAYYEALTAGRSVEVGGELLRVAESSAAAARKRVESGDTAYQEQLRAEMQLEQARADLAGLRRDSEVARQRLAALLGGKDLENTRLTGTLAESADERLLRAHAEAWIEAHPSMRTALANLSRAEIEARRARLEPYPDVNVGVAGGRVGESDESILELSVSIPLPVFDRGQGRKREAAAEVTGAGSEVETIRLRLLREWAGALARYRAAAAQVESYRGRLLPKAEEALRLVRVGFEEGKFGFIDLVDTQRTTAEARLAYQEKVLELNVAGAELEALIRPESASGNSTK